MKKIRPLADHIIIRRAEAEKRSAGGIIIPDTAKDKPQTGTVLAVGPGKRLESGDYVPSAVKPEDVVMFFKYSGGNDLKDLGEGIIVMREDDIIGVIED